MTDGVDVREFNKQVVEQFRAGGGHGKLGPVEFEKLLLLTTTGRRSGAHFTVPLGAAPFGDGDWVLFGSNMGARDEPDWVRNIRRDPAVHVEITGAEFDTDAVILTGEARGEAYQSWMDYAPHTAGHQEQAGREIPMVLIRRPT